MRLARRFQARCRVVAAAVLMGAILIAGLGAQPAQAASLSLTQHSSGQVRPFVGCSPCISTLDPPNGGTAKADATGKVTLTFTAQLDNPFVKFVLTLDGTAVDSTQIQVDQTDPMQPVGKYTAALSAGQHSAEVDVDDSNGQAAAFPGWTFTVQAVPTPVPSPTKTTAGTGTGGNTGNGSGTSSGTGGFTPKTLSIILFSIAGLGLLVIIFIAGMWYAGSRELRKNP